MPRLSASLVQQLNPRFKQGGKLPGDAARPSFRKFTFREGLELRNVVLPTKFNCEEKLARACRKEGIDRDEKGYLVWGCHGGSDQNCNRIRRFPVSLSFSDKIQPKLRVSTAIA